MVLLLALLMMFLVCGSVSAHDTGDTVSMDDQYPTVEIESPKHNDSVGHVVHITGRASYTPNQTAISKVVVTINNTDYEINDTANGWQYDWDTNNFANGEYSIRATVFALDNKTGTPKNLTAAKTILVNLNNCFNTKTTAFDSRGTPNQQTIWLNALLQDKNNNPLTGKTVEFLINGLWVGNGTSNDKGMVFCNYTPLTAGTFNITAKFAGDESHNSSQSNSVLRILNNLPSTTLNYSTYFSGSNSDIGRVFFADENYIYFAGATNSDNAVPNDFPTVTKRFGPGSTGNFFDIFLVKMDHKGNLIWNVIIGGSSNDDPKSIAVDKEGNVYLVGFTRSNDFPTTEGSWDQTYGGVTDAFIVKVNSSGDLINSTYLGGRIMNRGWAIALDNEGNVYVAGVTNSPDFQTTDGAFQTRKMGPVWEISDGTSTTEMMQKYLNSCDAFITKFNSQLSTLIYSTYLGGSQAEQIQDIRVDSYGNAYVIGEETVSTDFPTTPGVIQEKYHGGTQDSFVTKINPTGTALVYSTYIGGSGYDTGRRMELDANGNVYIIGVTDSSDLPTSSNPFQKTYSGIGTDNQDGFIIKLNKNATAVYYSSYLGGTGLDVTSFIAIDSAGSAYVTGYTTSLDFPVTSDAYQSFNAGSTDIFVTKISPDGKKIQYSTYLGGSQGVNGPGAPVGLNPDEGPVGIVLANGGFYISGYTQSANFPVSNNAYQKTTKYNGNATGTNGAGVYDTFITHFNNPTQLDTSKVTYKNNILSFKTTLTSNNSPIAGKKVKFLVNGKVVGTGITDKKGTASFNYKILARPGNYTVASQFDKTNEYNETSSNYRKFAVKKYKYAVKVRYKVKYKKKYKKWYKIHGKWRSYTTYKWKTKWKTKKITKTVLKGVNL